jgi:hypothetical protein
MLPANGTTPAQLSLQPYVNEMYGKIKERYIRRLSENCPDFINSTLYPGTVYIQGTYIIYILGHVRKHTVINTVFNNTESDAITERSVPLLTY